MNPEVLLALILIIPASGALLIALTGRSPTLRETITLITSGLLLLAVCSLLSSILGGARVSLSLIEVIPGIPIALTAEPLGILFAGLAAFLWPINSLYSIGYMRANKESHQTRFYVCFAMALFSAMGIALSGNLLTLFIFYELLTLSTYPLVTHKGDEKAKKAGRLYLGILIGTSIGLFLPGIIWVWHITGTLDFIPGGGLAAHNPDSPLLGGLMILFLFGIGKAALMPLHRWLPGAMVAPTPVSALLHAVAVVKAGVFSISKIIIYIFGTDLLNVLSSLNWFIAIPATTMILASMIALTKNNLKARLAYSTVGQLSYIVLGVLLVSDTAMQGSLLHMVTHAMGKITLFFCAGAIYTVTHKTEVSQLSGLGRRMPITFGAFFIGALSITGLPPLGGCWSKWFLLQGAAEEGYRLILGLFLISSLLNVAYLLPVVGKGFFQPNPEATGQENASIQEAPLLCLIPLCLTALGCLVLFFGADVIYELIQRIPLE